MRLSVFLAIFAFSLSVVNANATAITIVGDDSYPPYSYNDHGVTKGIYTDIIRTAVKKIPEFSVIIETRPWKRGLRMLENGEIPFLYPPYKRPRERPYMSYSVPILDEKLVLFCRKDLMVSPRPNFPDDYKGLSIGENLGFSSGATVNKAKSDGVIRLSSAKGTVANLKKLILKRLDCYINDKLSILVELKALEKSNSYDGSSIVEAATLSIEQGFLGVATKGATKQNQSCIEKFNSVILDMKKNGDIDTIIKNHTE